MKVVILAGGKGSRISFYTQKIPKPMIRIGNIPMITHIMRIFNFYGFDKFIIASGYKGNLIKNYYKNSKEFPNIKVINTGINTMTGGRLKRLKSFIGNETFLLTYGDAVTDLDINQVIKFHKEHGKIITVTAVRPPARFGELKINQSNEVIDFKEKPNATQGWINGGFFVIEPEFLNYLGEDSCILEKEPLENAAKSNQLVAFLHDGFWHCIDTKRDKDSLEEIIKSDKKRW